MDNISVIKKNCTGCGLCRSACPKKCIRLAEYPNNGHFYYPEIDERECNLCGKCLAYGPVYDLKSTNIIALDAYLYYCQNKEILSNSTSSGAFGVSASYALTNHGVFYGVTWINKLTVERTRIDNIDNLFLLYKSKYIQSMINRESCYSSPFRGYRFFSDTALGDFWNLEKNNDSFLNSDNKSLLVINSVLGKRIVEKIISDDNCIFKKYSVGICLNNASSYFNNPSRRNSSKFLKNRGKNGYFATYSLKIRLFKPYFALKNLAKNYSGKKLRCCFL